MKRVLRIFPRLQSCLGGGNRFSNRICAIGLCVPRKRNTCSNSRFAPLSGTACEHAHNPACSTQSLAGRKLRLLIPVLERALVLASERARRRQLEIRTEEALEKLAPRWRNPELQ